MRRIQLTILVIFVIINFGRSQTLNVPDNIGTSTNAGKVGIGLNNPASTLEVNGDISLARTHKIKFLETVGGNDRAYIRSTGSTADGWNDIIFGTTNVSGQTTDRFFFKSSGMFGIGTNSPNSKLTINGGINNVYSYSTTATDQPGFVVGDNTTYATSTQILYLKNYNSDITATIFGQIAGNWSVVATDGTNSKGLLFGTLTNDPIILGTNNTERMRIAANGNAVLYGKFEAKEIKVQLAPTADFVFNEDYNLKEITEVESFIKENKHLPNFPSGKEIEENGVNLGEMNAKLLQKIEELTLYVIDLNKKVGELEKWNKVLEEKLNIN